MHDADNIINNTLSEILDDSRKKLMNLLSLCESPIEKIFLMKLYSFFHRMNASTEGSDFKILNRYLTNQEEHIVSFDFNNSKSLSTGVYQDPVGPFCLKTEGLLFKANGITYRIYPQLALDLGGIKIRLDFALISETYSEENKSPEYKQFCIECDGHEFHKEKEQRSSDNKRMRILTEYKWQTIRYTGTQIYQLTDDGIAEFENSLCRNITGKTSQIYLFRKI